MHIKESLQNCHNSSEILGFVNHLKPQVNFLGGRRFIHLNEKGSICFNDLLSKIQELNINTPFIDESNLEEKKQIFEQIETLDKEANRILAKRNIFTRLLTAIKSFFGNNNENRLLKNSYLHGNRTIINEFNSAINLKQQKYIQSLQLPNKYEDKQSAAEILENYKENPQVKELLTKAAIARVDKERLAQLNSAKLLTLLSDDLPAVEQLLNQENAVSFDRLIEMIEVNIPLSSFAKAKPEIQKEMMSHFPDFAKIMKEADSIGVIFDSIKNILTYYPSISLDNIIKSGSPKSVVNIFYAPYSNHLGYFIDHDLPLSFMVELSDSGIISHYLLDSLKVLLNQKIKAEEIIKIKPEHRTLLINKKVVDLLEIVKTASFQDLQDLAHENAASLEELLHTFTSMDRYKLHLKGLDFKEFARLPTDRRKQLLQEVDSSSKQLRQDYHEWMDSFQK